MPGDTVPKPPKNGLQRRRGRGMWRSMPSDGNANAFAKCASEVDTPTP
jgi:hypothetical protein